MYWLPVTAGYAAAPVAGAIGLLFVLGWSLRSYELRGPTSSAGLQPVIAVRDAGLGIGADFYCDLRVLDATGAVIAERQLGSQHPRGGPQLLRDSMQWTSPDTLAFTTRTGAEQLNMR